MSGGQENKVKCLWSKGWKTREANSLAKLTGLGRPHIHKKKGQEAEGEPREGCEPLEIVDMRQGGENRKDFKLQMWHVMLLSASTGMCFQVWVQGRGEAHQGSQVDYGC